jgi:2-polyprenyl-3-methyl-5-hydroxy-6-metoxy-1,4-benzoquinol methylase
MAFESSAQLYDSIYEGKNYEREVLLISEIFSSRNSPISKILDVGCGTGTHSILLAKQNQWRITAIDSSAEMIDCARNKAQNDNLSIEFLVLPINQISELSGKFDVVMALFHVVNYIPSSKALTHFFNSSKELLNPNGILLFDMWNGKLCSRERFKEKRITFKSHGKNWQRISTPELDDEHNKVQIKHSYLSTENPEKEFIETHDLAFWTANDVVAMAGESFSRVEILESENGESFNELTHWSPLFIMQE